jgi:hypothetical protein
MTIQLSDLISEANKQLDLQLAVEKLESELKTKKEAFRVISQEIVPNMMMELGVEKFVLNGGYELSIKDEVYAKLPENPFVAFEWLRSHDLDAVIKTQVSVDFGKGEDAEANRVLDTLSTMGVQAKVKSTIHPQTLKALLREQISMGAGIPMDDFGATVVKTTVIRSPI